MHACQNTGFGRGGSIYIYIYIYMLFYIYIYSSHFVKREGKVVHGGADHVCIYIYKSNIPQFRTFNRQFPPPPPSIPNPRHQHGTQARLDAQAYRRFAPGSVGGLRREGSGLPLFWGRGTRKETLSWGRPHFQGGKGIKQTFFWLGDHVLEAQACPGRLALASGGFLLGLPWNS